MGNNYVRTYGRRPFHANNVGDRFSKVKKAVTEDGVRKLVVTGERDDYAVIQSYKDDCLIENIMRRYDAGDDTALHRVAAMYGDVTGVAMSTIEAHNLMERARNLYDNLNPSVTAEFGGTLQNFLQSLGTVQGMEKFINLTKPRTDNSQVNMTPTTTESEVTTNA